jgi:hypothetical protein
VSDVPFHRTVIGHRFFEHQLPEMIRQLARIADQLERLHKATDKPQPAPQGDAR